MIDYKELRKDLNDAKMSIQFNKTGSSKVRDSAKHEFRGMSVSDLEEIQGKLVDVNKKDTEEYFKKHELGTMDTLETAMKRAKDAIGPTVLSLAKGQGAVAAHDSYAGVPYGVRDSVVNPSLGLGIHGVDPSMAAAAFPNIYISPYQASALYSQKGIFETIINKKCKSILLNGISITNPMLSQEELDKVKERMEVLNFKSVLSDSVRDSLTYGGELTFPMFKKDTPLTTSLSLSSLIDIGVVGKNCIDYFVQLDRWNTFIIPPYNPTQKDFLNPSFYIVPFLGSEVHRSRCARIVTAKQAGYYGQVINQGWGISDLCGYLQSGLNYKVTIQAIPLMIQQMSILARVINIDPMLATEGINALDDLINGDTMKMRELSANNPITMDVVGDIKTLDRNFSQVAELVRLLRQDVASDATIPEPMLWSSEKGNFASGDDTEGNLNKQWEAVKIIHKSVEPQVKQLMKIIVIDTLGVSDHVMKALQYTQVRFDEPVIANALDRAKMGEIFSKNVFQLVSARLPVDKAVEIASKYMPEDMAVPNDVLKQLGTIQQEGDKRDEKEFKLNMEKTEAEIKSIEEGIKADKAMAAAGPSIGKPAEKDDKDKSPAEKKQEKALGKGKGYSKLEQAQHAKTRVGMTKRSEGLAKKRNLTTKE